MADPLLPTKVITTSLIPGRFRVAQKDPKAESWYPRGFEFLTGVPDPARRRRRIAVIQAFVDESGLDGKGRLLVFSALIGTAEDWVDFSDRWKAALDEPPEIDYFKMDEAVGFSDEFYNWSPSQRNAKLIRLAGEIRGGKYPILEHTVTADLDAIEREWRPRTIKPANEPYFWPFHITIRSIGRGLVGVAHDEPFEIYFDEHVIFGPRAKAWYPVIRAMAEPELKRVLPVEPFFRSDKDTMPLQAADMTAWLTRATKTGNAEFEWLREHLSAVSPFGPQVHFGSEEIAKALVTT